MSSTHYPLPGARYPRLRLGAPGPGRYGVSVAAYQSVTWLSADAAPVLVVPLVLALVLVLVLRLLLEVLPPVLPLAVVVVVVVTHLVPCTCCSRTV